MKTNKFISIYNDLTEKISKAEYQSNSLLPSENDLCNMYETSRETIRKALNLLSQNGYIQKVRGKGSIVLDVSRLKFPVSGLVSFKELATLAGNNWRTKVHRLELGKPTDEIKRNLFIASPTEEVWKVVRSREIDGERIILDIDHIKKQFVPSLTKEICENSIYEYFEKELGLVISFAKKEITVEEVTEEDKELLDLNGLPYIVVVRNFVYLDDASILQYTESRHRLDKFKFTDFARREV